MIFDALLTGRSRPPWLALVVLLLGGPARGDAPTTAVTADRLVPVSAGAGLVTLEDPLVGGHRLLRLGLDLSSAADPVLLSLREADDQQVLAVVDQVTTLTLSAALELWGKLRLGLALPLHSLDGDRLAGLGQDRQFAAMAAGDLRLGATWNIYRGSRLPLAVALGLLVTLPTGDDSSFASFGRVGFAPRLLLAYAPLSWLRLLGQVGGSFGQTREFYGTMWGRRLLLGLGLELGLPWIPWVDRHLSLVAEAESNPGFSDDSDPPLELRGGVRLRMQRWHLLLSAGGGLGDGVTVPGWRVTLGASVVLWGVKTKPGS